MAANLMDAFGLASFSKIYPPEEGKLNFQNIDLGKYAFIKTLLGKEITGKANGNLAYISANEISGNGSGTIALFLTKGTYPLAEPFLGLNRIDFDRGEIKAQFKNGSPEDWKSWKYPAPNKLFLKR